MSKNKFIFIGISALAITFFGWKMLPEKSATSVANTGKTADRIPASATETLQPEISVNQLAKADADLFETFKNNQESETEVRARLNEMGLTDVQVSYDEKGIMKISAAGPTLSGDTVNDDLQREWDDGREQQALRQINGDNFTLTVEDEEAVRDFKQSITKSDYDQH